MDKISFTTKTQVQPPGVSPDEISSLNCTVLFAPLHLLQNYCHGNSLQLLPLLSVMDGFVQIEKVWLQQGNTPQDAAKAYMFAPPIRAILQFWLRMT